MAFQEQKDADDFAASCEAYQKLEPDDDYTEWANNHPGRPYLSQGAHLYDVDYFPVVELPVM